MKKIPNGITKSEGSYISPFLEILKPYKKPNYQKTKRTASFLLPREFSLINNPDAALNTIYELVAYSRTTKKIPYVMLDHSQVESIDLTAEAVFDQVAFEIRRERRSKKRKIRFKGHFPQDEKLRRFLKGIGIIKSLKVEHEYLPTEQERMLDIFAERSGSAAKNLTVGSMDYKENIIKKFIDHIDACLKKNNRRLTDIAINSIGQYTSEILDNAEQHSGKQDWSILGYYDHEDNSHICEIAVFNVGKTISDTFLGLEKDSFAFKDILKYIDFHKKNNFFSNNWREQDLITVAALQGDVSCQNCDEEDTRGHGTVEIIEFFEKMHLECTGETMSPKMAIISGDTHVLFDGTYRMEPDKNGRKIIAFNSGNDLAKAPDPNYVKKISNNYFPGVIIAIRFGVAESQTDTTESL